MSDLVERLKKRAEIRRSITTRKSVQEGKPDRIADILEEAAARIAKLEQSLDSLGSAVVMGSESDIQKQLILARQVLDD
jgi:hypothetical protein